MLGSVKLNSFCSAEDRLSAREAAVLINSVKASGALAELAQGNVLQTLAFLDNAPAIASFSVLSWQTGSEIVRFGEFVKDNFEGRTSLQYACVPLGIILKGEIVVIKEGKTTKRLLPGDFIGLFETAYFLHSDSARKIGLWSLTADSEAEILFFNDIHRLKIESSSTFMRFRNYLIDSARTDLVPKPITDLPLLDHIAGKITDSLLDETVILAHTHVLPTSLALFRHLAQLVGYQNLFVLEKPYSTVRATARDLIQMGVELVPVLMIDNAPYEFAVKRSVEILWDKVINIQKRRNIRKILIIDDGGDLFLSIPWEKLDSIEIVGVEQTQRGINRMQGTAQRLPPIVSVAASHVKKQIESIFIGKASVDKMKNLRLLDCAPKVGIIGIGSIGSAICNELTKIGIDFVTYDVQRHLQVDRGQQALTSIDAVLNKADLILGCSGEDLLKGVALERINGSKTLISTSSADVEFFSLLNLTLFGNTGFDTITVNVHPRLQVKILNGGYPINFDRQREWEPTEDIQVTRSLLYAGLIQATRLKAQDYGHVIDLDLEWQQQIINKWHDLKRDNDAINRQVG